MRALAAVLLLTLALTACSRTEDGYVKVHNGTSHLLFVTYAGEIDTLQGGGTVSYSVPVKNPWSPFDAGEKDVVVGITGETFLWVDSNSHPFYETAMTVEPEKTTHAYIWPDYACVKVVNLSGKRIESVTGIMVDENGQHTTLQLIAGVEPGETKYRCIEYGTPDDPLTYDFRVLYEDGSEAEYPGIVMENDDLYLIN